MFRDRIVKLNGNVGTVDKPRQILRELYDVERIGFGSCTISDH